MNLPKVPRQSSNEGENQEATHLGTSDTPDHRKTNPRTKIFDELPPLPSDKNFKFPQSQQKEGDENLNPEQGYYRKKRKLSQSVQTKTRRKLNLSASAPTLVTSARVRKKREASWTKFSPALRKKIHGAPYIEKRFEQHLKSLDLDENNIEWDNQLKIKNELDFHAQMLNELAQQLEKKNADGAHVLKRIVERSSKLSGTLYKSHRADRKRLSRLAKNNAVLAEKEKNLENRITNVSSKSELGKHATGSMLDMKKLQEKSDEKVRAQETELLLQKKEVLNLKKRLDCRDSEVSKLDEKVKLISMRLAAQNGKSLHELFASESETRFLLLDGIPLETTDQELIIHLEPLGALKNTGKFPSNPEVTSMACIVEFSSEAEAKVAKSVLQGEFRVTFAREYPVPLLTIDCGLPKEDLILWFGKFGDIKQLKRTSKWCIISYHDLKSACAALVYLAGRNITIHNTTYFLDMCFANDTRHIVWDQEYARDQKQNKLEKRCFSLAYVVDLLEREVQAKGGIKIRNQYSKSQLDDIAGDLEARLNSIDDALDAMKKKAQEEFKIKIETNEKELKNQIESLKGKFNRSEELVTMTKSSLKEANEEFLKLQCQKITRKRIVRRSLIKVKGQTVLGEADDHNTSNTEQNIVIAHRDKHDEENVEFLKQRILALQSQLREFETMKKQLTKAQMECKQWEKKCKGRSTTGSATLEKSSRSNPSLREGSTVPTNLERSEEWRGALEEKLVSYEKEIAKYRARIEELEARQPGDDTELHKLRDEVKKLTDRLRVTGHPGSSTKISHDKPDKLQKELDAMKTELADRDAEINRLKQQLTMHLGNKQKRVSSADPAKILLNMHDNLEEKIEEKKAEVRLKEYAARIEQLEIDLERAQEALKKASIDGGVTVDLTEGSVSAVLSDAKRSTPKVSEAVLASLPTDVRAELEELRRQREVCVKLHGIFEEEEVDDDVIERISREGSRPRSRSQTAAVVSKLVKERDSANNQNKWKKLLELEQKAHMDTKRRYRKEFQKVQMECERLQEQIDGKPRSRNRWKRNQISNNTNGITTAISRGTNTEEATLTTSGIPSSPSERASPENSFVGNQTYVQLANLQARNRFLEIEFKKLQERSEKDRLHAEQNAKWLKLIQAQRMQAKKKATKPMVMEQPKLPPPKEKRTVEKKWRMTPYRFLQITKGEHANRSLKTKQWLVRNMQEIYTAKRMADNVAVRGNVEIMPLPEFLYHEYLPSKLGIKDLVDAMCWDLHNAVQEYSKAHIQEVVTFKAFLEEDESPEVLSFYLSAREFLEAQTKSRSQVVDASQFSAIVDFVFPQASNSFRFEMVEALELHAYSLSGRNEIDIHIALDLFIQYFKGLQLEYRKNCLKLFFHMGLNRNPEVEFSDFLPLIRVILSDISEDKLQSTICRLKTSKIGSLPIQQFIDTVEDFHALRLHFHVPTRCNTHSFKKDNTMAKFVQERWKKLQSTILDDILDNLGNIGGDYIMLSPIRLKICHIRDLSAHLNTCIVNGFIWESMTTFAAILSTIRQCFDLFDFLHAKSDHKKVMALIGEQEAPIYARVAKIVALAEESSDRSNRTKPRYFLNPNQRPSDERDRLLQKMVMEEFATNVHLRMNITPKPRSRQQAWVKKVTASAPTAKRSLFNKNEKRESTESIALPMPVAFRGDLNTAEGPEVKKIRIATNADILSSPKRRLSEF